MKYTKLPKYTKQTCDVEAAARARPEAPERHTVHTGAPGALNLGEATMGRPRAARSLSVYRSHVQLRKGNSECSLKTISL